MGRAHCFRRSWSTDMYTFVDSVLWCPNTVLITGMDILNGKGILTNRKEEHQLLMDIRNGKIPFDEIFMLVDEYQGRFELAAKSTTLPDEPDFSGIDGMLVGLYS